MFLLFFLIAQDSIPPLPDLSRVRFPEPHLWIESVGNSLYLSGYAGNFYGGDCNFKYQHFHVSALYKQETLWDSITSGTINASYSIPLHHFWIRPSIYGYLLQRADEYKVLVPSLQFSSTLPWAIIFGKLNYDLWQINQRNYTEEEARLAVIFDRVRFLPGLEISEIYTGDKIKPTLSGQLHIRNFHLNIGSPIFYDFPSPFVEIAYREPKITVETKVKSGAVYQTLHDYFDPDFPINYRSPVPEESLNVELGFGFKFDLYEHLFRLYASYKNWRIRTSVGDDFEIITVNDVQETNIEFTLKNSFVYGLINASNSLHIQYNRSDIKIPFLPEYALLDTVRVNYGYIEIASEIKYLSKRDGITKTLPSMLIINPKLGLVFKFLKVFLVIYNITDKEREIFDNYFLNDRQFAGGLEIDYKF